MDIDITLGSNTFKMTEVGTVDQFVVDLFRAWVAAQGDGSGDALKLETITGQIGDTTDTLRDSLAAHTPGPPPIEP